MIRRRRYLTPNGMGADAGPNRLLLIPPRAIAVRIYGLAKPGSRPDAAWNAEVAATLKLVRDTGASAEENRDLSLIDGLFGGGVPTFGPKPDNATLIPKLADFIAGMTQAQAIGIIKKRAYDMALAQARTMVYEPFFAVPPLRVPLVHPQHTNYQQMLSITHPAGFKLNQDLPWGQVRQATWNAANICIGMENYPWPKMLGMPNDVSYTWWLLELANVRDMIHSGVPKSAEDVRLYATMTLLSRAEEIAARVQSMVEERVRHAAQFEKTRMIAMAATALVMSAALGPALAGAVGVSNTVATGVLKGVLSIGMKSLSAQDAVAAQKNMLEIQSKMQSDDPAFAREMQSGIDFLDGQIANLAQQPPLETAPPPPAVETVPAVTPTVQAPSVTESSRQTPIFAQLIPQDPFPVKPAVQPGGYALTPLQAAALSPTTVVPGAVVTTETVTAEEAKAIPADRYDVMVEGTRVGTVASLQQAASLAISRSGTGDRSWITKNGSFIGMGIMAPGGFVPVPSENAKAVMAMSREEVLSGLTRAAQTAADVTGTPDPTKKGVSAWWALLAVPIAVYAVAKGGS